MTPEGSLFFVAFLPHPWPPSEVCLLLGGETAGQPIELLALTDGRFSVTIVPTKRSFVSQPIDFISNGPRSEMITITWTTSKLNLRIAGQLLLEDAAGGPRLLLPPQLPVPNEVSILDPGAVAACRKWIQNRKSKFGSPKSPRSNRRRKTIEEQASDLKTSVLVLRQLQRHVIAGHTYMLGALAGEMRACVYWRKDAQPDPNLNPLLLRMANLAELPLPVYFIPAIPEPSIIAESVMSYSPSEAPRLERRFLTEKVCDLQESLVTTVLRLGQSPGRTISALDLIAELAHTMGSAHYDEEASDFLEVMRSMKSEDGDQVTIFICETAEVIMSLSEWVLSELKSRQLIT